MTSKSEMRRQSVLDPAWAAERIYELEQEVLELKALIRTFRENEYSGLDDDDLEFYIGD